MNVLNQHDKLIQAAYDGLDKTNHDVYANYNQQKNTSINGQFPDIIVTLKNDKNVKFIIEVETENSITINETKQWKVYSELCETFYLLVPFSLKTKAELLCVQNGIKARFGTYKVSRLGYQISYE